jgi:hypothetical protein
MICRGQPWEEYLHETKRGKILIFGVEPHYSCAKLAPSRWIFVAKSAFSAFPIVPRPFLDRIERQTEPGLQIDAQIDGIPQHRGAAGADVAPPRASSRHNRHTLFATRIATGRHGMKRI